MKTVIADKKELALADESLRKTMAGVSSSSATREWAFPNGEKAVCKTYSVPTDLGELLFAIRKDQAYLFSLGHEGGVPAPDVEINIPDKLDRKVSGAFVKGDGQIWLCTRGAFTAYRGKIPKERSLRHFEKRLETVEDGDKTASLIKIGSLDSASLANDIAKFVSLVSELKKQIKTEKTKSK